MKLVYTNPSGIVVAQSRSALELAGIDCMIRNEYASGAIGELAPIDAWPELWVLKDHEFERAQRLIEASHAQIDELDWTCDNCGSASPATFEVCWSCALIR